MSLVGKVAGGVGWWVSTRAQVWGWWLMSAGPLAVGLGLAVTSLLPNHLLRDREFLMGWDHPGNAEVESVTGHLAGPRQLTQVLCESIIGGCRRQRNRPGSDSPCWNACGDNCTRPSNR